MNPLELAKFIDHTILKPEATAEDIERLCREAKEYGFAAVCINPHYVRSAAKFIEGSELKVCGVVGFPLGATSTSAKGYEAQEQVYSGAQELDMVMNIGALKDKRYEVVRDDIQLVVRSAQGALVKVIIETCLLTDDEKITAARIVQEAGAQFVKTSTGFNKAGATVEDVKLLRRAVGDSFGVKASGGIRDLKTTEALITAGANRIGTSSGVAIIEEARLNDKRLNHSPR
jgi:deoxyribose-phosphate aldolase